MLRVEIAYGTYEFSSHLLFGDEKPVIHIVCHLFCSKLNNNWFIYNYDQRSQVCKMAHDRVNFWRFPLKFLNV